MKLNFSINVQHTGDTDLGQAVSKKVQDFCYCSRYVLYIAIDEEIP